MNIILMPHFQNTPAAMKLLRKVVHRLKLILSAPARLWKLEILVLGDSHAKVFSDPRIAMPGYWFNVKSVGGATISGLKNPNSVTQAQPIFEKAIGRIKGKICITLLGEVDTGFVIWYRAKKHGINVEDMLETTVLNYIDFIEKIPIDKHVIIIGAPLPTIQDDQDWGEISNARKEVTASQRQRTDLTLQLNQRMESYAKKSGVMFVNLDAESLSHNGVLKEELLNSNRENHHYDKEAYIKLLKPKLVKHLEQVGEGNVTSRRA
jgi:hypothetical protein